MSKAATATVADESPAVAALDWTALEDQLDDSGFGMTPPLLTPDQCAEVIDMYDDDACFRSTIVMPGTRSAKAATATSPTRSPRLCRRCARPCTRRSRASRTAGPTGSTTDDSPRPSTTCSTSARI
jgi:hypothetical protein